MQRNPITNSSNIIAAGYDADSSTMEIEFPRGGVYRYLSVPYGEYKNLITAPSPGRFFHQAIKGHYEFQRVA